MQVVKLGGQVPADSGRLMPSSSSSSTSRPAHAAPRGIVPSPLAAPARLPSDDMGVVIPGQKRTSVFLWIPTALMRGQGQDAYHVYQVMVRLGDEEWSIFRRYSHFHDLHK